MWAIVPLKSLESAKRRLAGKLSAGERRDLMLAMARDVLAALCRAKRLSGILIVSRTPEADALAQTFSTERFAESPDADLPEALTQASAYLTRHFGARGVMVIPADVPLIRSEEVDDILKGHAEMEDEHGAVTVVPDGENLGTNCLVLSPPDVIGFVFDGKSFRPHVEAAFARGLTPRIVQSRGFALDIDTEDDLRHLLKVGRSSQTCTFLEKSGISGRLEGSAAGSAIDKGNPEATP
ncbi:MAG: 2-phospho-L-lactate guanylyltransferase [Pseudomonadales bacterium]